MDKCNEKKRRIYGFIAFFSIFMIPVLANAVGKDHLMMVAYFSNAEVQVVLSSKDSPEKVIASARATPGTVYRSSPITREYKETPSLAVIGHPTNMAFKDSPLIAFAAALDQLRVVVEDVWPELKSDKELLISYFLAGIAGFDEFHNQIIDDMTKEEFDQLHWMNILTERHFTPPGSSKHIIIKGDHTLITRAAQQSADSHDELPDVDLVQLTTFAQAYRMRDDALVPGSGQIYSTSLQGGYYGFGIKIQKEIFSKLPDNPKIADLKNATLLARAILLRLNQRPTSQLYGEVPWDGVLHKTRIDYEVPTDDLPKRDKNLFIGRIQEKFKNEAGYLGSVLN